MLSILYQNIYSSLCLHNEMRTNVIKSWLNFCLQDLKYKMVRSRVLLPFRCFKKKPLLGFLRIHNLILGQLCTSVWLLQDHRTLPRLHEPFYNHIHLDLIPGLNSKFSCSWNSYYGCCLYIVCPFSLWPRGFYHVVTSRILKACRLVG